jgi:heme b synthase
MEFVPKWIAWEVTGRCNLRCIHCRSSSEMESFTSDFTTDEAKKLLDDIAGYCKPVLVLSGGEPLMRSDLFEIAKYGSDLGLRMCIATNGTLINDEICEQMKASGIKMVSLSLDGSTKEIHDNFRQQEGAFEGALRGIEYLKKHNIEFLINSSFSKRNQHDIENVYRLAKRLGATAWYLFMIVPTGRGEGIMEELISAADYEKILNWHYDMEAKERDMLVRPTCAPQYYRIVLQRQKAEGKKFERRNLKFSTGAGKGCVAAQVICFIDNRGNVQPCSYFPTYAGNVKQKSFREIWENSPLFKDIRDFNKYAGDCGVCEYRTVCGGCRARADAVHGDYLAKEPYCDYIPLLAGKLKKEPVSR